MNEQKDKIKWWQRLRLHFTLKPHESQDILDLLDKALNAQTIDKNGYQMMKGVLDMSERQARDVMVPRSQLTLLSEGMTVKDALSTILETGHSRFPVTNESNDRVVGILLAKDLLQITQKPELLDEPLKHFVRPVVFTPESKRLNTLLKEFRMKRNHMAVVVDEYGTIDGLVTIEDILEQIVGEIEDEYDAEDEEDHFIQACNAEEFIVLALTPVETFNAYFGTNFEHEDCDTIGGLIIKSFNYLPKTGETLTIGNFTVTVLEAHARHIERLSFTRKEQKHA